MTRAAVNLTGRDLAAVVEKFKTMRREFPIIRPSAWVPRGMAFEYQEPNLFGPVIAILPDGRLQYETRPVLIVNEQDFRADAPLLAEDA